MRAIGGDRQNAVGERIAAVVIRQERAEVEQILTDMEIGDRAPRAELVKMNMSLPAPPVRTSAPTPA